MQNKSKLVGLIIVGALTVALWARPSITIYNQDFAVVRDQLNLSLQKGTNTVTCTEVTAALEPESVILRDRSGTHKLQILEQNYRGDTLSLFNMLKHFEGKNIEFLTDNGIVDGTIIRAGTQKDPMQDLMRFGYDPELLEAHGLNSAPIVKVNGRIRFDLPGKPLFPALQDDTVLKPTLEWLIASDHKADIDAELCYITRGMEWEADYNLIFPLKGDMAELIGWITVKNHCGKTFHDTHIKLMAGDIEKKKEMRYSGMGGGGMMGGGMMGGMGGGPQVTERMFDEYHLYTLSRPTTLYDRQSKQVEFVRAQKVRSKAIYVYDGVKTQYGSHVRLDNREFDYGTQSNKKVWIFRSFENKIDNQLGIPLPQGRVRCYRRDSDGQIEFIGEDDINHTPKDETVRLYTGNAFDLVGHRKRVDYHRENQDKILVESFDIELMNHKSQDTVAIRVIEHLDRGNTWRILSSSNPYTKTDSHTIEFHITVESSKPVKVTYQVEYRDARPTSRAR